MLSKGVKYYLRPPLLIHGSKSRTWRSKYWKFMKLSWQKKRRNEKWIQIVALLSVTFSRIFIGLFCFHIHILGQHKQRVCMRFYYFSNVRCIVGIYMILCNFFIVFNCMGRCSLQYFWQLSLSDIWWNSMCLLICIWVVNQHLSQFFSKIHNSIIHIEEIFHPQVWIHFSESYEKIKNSDGLPSNSSCIIQTNLSFSPTIMTKGISIVHPPPYIGNYPQQHRYT